MLLSALTTLNRSPTTTMTDREALYRAIVANPADDTPRLVYADWLQENDRPEEAEFIRIQCALEAASPDHPEYVEWLTREEELKLWLTAHLPGPMPKLAAGLSVEGGKNWWEWTRRGFPKFLEFEANGRSASLKSMRELATAIENAIARLPTRWLVLRFVTIRQLAEILRQPVAEQIESISVQIGGDEGWDEVARVLAESRLRNLREASPGTPFGDAGATALAGSNNFARLEWLDLPRDVGPTGVRTLGATAWFRNLKSLRVDYGEMFPAAFEELCRLEPFPRLHTLNLTQESFPVTSWQTFARSKTFPALTRLDLSRANLSEGRAAVLFAAPWLRLAYLDLDTCAIWNDGAAALANAPWIGSLRYLLLGTNGLDPSGAAAIAGCRKLTRLMHLDLSNNTLGIRGLRALAGNPALRGLISLKLADDTDGNPRLTPGNFHEFLTKLNMPSLRHLSLADQPVGPKAARLLTSEKFRNLTRLNLSRCQLSNAAVSALLTAPALQNMIELNLDGNGLHEGLRPLVDRNTMPRLSVCSVTFNRIGADLRKALKRRPVVQE
jgi:uncharacterized protein (TIGR02996 family)